MSNEIISQNGGTTRVQHGAPQTEVAAPVEHQSARAGSGVTQMTLGEGGAITQRSTARYSVGQDANTTSVAATLQRINGVETVELIPGMPSSRTLVRTALADGLLEHVDGAGRYRDRGASPQGAEGAPVAAPEARPEVAPIDPGLGVFDPVEDADWKASVELLPDHSFAAAAASVTVAVLSGSSNLDTATKQLAESAGISPELAASYTREGYAMHERIVAAEVASVGVTDKEGFYAWCRDVKGRALQNAVQTLTHGRDLAPFRNLALEYVRHSSPAAKTLRERLG